jgi:hypothetical protein
MKRIISVILVLTIFISIAVLPNIVNAKNYKGKYKSGESLVYVNKKIIYYSNKGIFIKKSAKAKAQKITDKKAVGTLLSDGKTVFFTVESGEAGIEHKRYTIYSVKTNGKQLTQITSSNIEADLVTYYKNCIYYLDNKEVGGTYPCCLFKYNLKTKEKKCISQNKLCARTFYYNKKIYFSNAVLSIDNVNYENLYSINLDNNKIKKVKNNAFAVDYCFSSSKACFSSYKWNNRKDIPVKRYIYTINKSKVKKSKKLPDNSFVYYVFNNGKKAICSKGDGAPYYIFNLKTGKKTRIKGFKGYGSFIGDFKSNKVYVKKDYNSNKLSLYKLNGSKLKKVKLSGKSSVKCSGYSSDCWVCGKYAIVKNSVNSYKIYKIK